MNSQQSFFHLDLFSAALAELVKSIPVHSLILSSHLFFCLPLFLFPFTVPCKIVFAKPEDLDIWPNHLSFRFLNRVRSSSLHGGAMVLGKLLLLGRPTNFDYSRCGWGLFGHFYCRLSSLFVLPLFVRRPDID